MDPRPDIAHLNQELLSGTQKNACLHRLSARVTTSNGPTRLLFLGGGNAATRRKKLWIRRAKCQESGVLCATPAIQRHWIE